MIANIFAILLCCFVITSNIKKIESVDNKIDPVRNTNVSLNENYIRTINKCKTFKEHPVVIERAQRRSLSSFDVILNRNEFRINLESQVTFEKKVLEIKCSFCVITKSNILYLNDLVEKLNRGEPFVSIEHEINRLEHEAKILVDLILFGNLEAGQWLWLYFLKIIAIRSYGDNRTLINKNPFDDDRLQTGVSNFINSCITAKYLPSIVMESDFVLKKRKIYKKIFSDIHVNSEGLRRYLLEHNNNTIIEFLYLKPFWNDERDLLFGQITGANVDWSVAKQRHEFEVVITRDFLDNRTWMNNPYGRLDHQHLLINIIDARIYCCLSVILHIHEIRFRVFKSEIVEVIKTALAFMAFKDDFLVDILSEFEMSTNTDDRKDILEKVKTKSNEILNKLMGTSNNAIDRLSIIINAHQLSHDDIFTYIEHLKDYLMHFNRILPLQYKVLLNFMGVVKTPASRYV